MTDNADDIDWLPSENDTQPSSVEPALPVAADLAEAAHDAVPDVEPDVEPTIVPDFVPDVRHDVALDDLPIAMVAASAAAGPSHVLGDSLHETEDRPIQSRSSGAAIWAVAALVVGFACGFGSGYVVGGRPRTAESAEQRAAPAAAPADAPLASPSAQAPPARDFTENALNDAPVESTPGRGDRDRDASVPLQASQFAAIGRVLVRSTPADAQVFVDGRERGRTPATIRDLAPGAHRVKVVREGYVPEDRPISITAERPAQSVSVNLERPHVATAPGVPSPANQSPAVDGSLVGGLDVESRPPDAQVFLDGMLVGTTPFASARITAGRHEIRLERDGYQRWQSSVTIVRGERNRITASLEQ